MLSFVFSTLGQRILLPSSASIPENSEGKMAVHSDYGEGASCAFGMGIGVSAVPIVRVYQLCL